MRINGDRPALKSFKISCDLVIALHHHGEVQSAMGPGHYYIEWHVNVPQGAMTLVTGLVVNDVFDKFPGLKFAIIESGYSWVPHIMWGLDFNEVTTARP